MKTLCSIYSTNKQRGKGEKKGAQRGKKERNEEWREERGRKRENVYVERKGEGMEKRRQAENESEGHRGLLAGLCVQILIPLPVWL